MHRFRHSRPGVICVKDVLESFSKNIYFVEHLQTADSVGCKIENLLETNFSAVISLYSDCDAPGNQM